MSPHEKRERLRQFESRCRERGLALTVQRRRILELVLSRTDHPTADQICAAARKHLRHISRTTVYRVLETLVEIGAITKAPSPGAATRFDPKTRRHHHLVCLHCDRLIDVEDKRLDAAVTPPDVREHSFHITDFSIHFCGICAACRQALEEGKSKSKVGRAKKTVVRPRKKTGNPRRRTRK